MIDLKVKCSICGKEESNKELVKEVAGIIEKYNLKSEQYLTLLNVMSGKCLDSDEHSFLFDEEFIKQVQEIVTKQKEHLAEVEKLKGGDKEINKEIDEIEIKLNELKTKLSSNNARTTNLQHEYITNVNELEKSVGYGKIEIWY